MTDGQHLTKKDKECDCKQTMKVIEVDRDSATMVCHNCGNKKIVHWSKK